MRGYRWLDVALPVWAKMALVLAVVGAVELGVMWLGIRLTESYVPAERRFAFGLFLMLALIWWKLDGIERRLRK